MGAGTHSTTDPRWWPLYHKTVKAGTKLPIGVESVDQLLALRRELGLKLKQILITMRAESLEQAEEILHLVSK